MCDDSLSPSPNTYLPGEGAPGPCIPPDPSQVVRTGFLSVLIANLGCEGHLPLGG